MAMKLLRVNLVIQIQCEDHYTICMLIRKRKCRSQLPSSEQLEFKPALTSWWKTVKPSLLLSHLRKLVGKIPTHMLILRDPARLIHGISKFGTLYNRKWWGHYNRPIDIFSKKVINLHLYRTVFQQRSNLHAGMLKKPLEPYHPNAFRSKLP